MNIEVPEDKISIQSFYGDTHTVDVITDEMLSKEGVTEYDNVIIVNAKERPRVTIRDLILMGSLADNEYDPLKGKFLSGKRSQKKKRKHSRQRTKR